MELEIFKQKVAPLREKLYQQSFKKVRNSYDAEDIVQEVMLRLWEKRCEAKNIEAYAATMVKNASINKVRDRKPTSEILLNFVQEMDKNPDKRLENKDSIEFVQKIIENLPYLQKTIIRMRDIEGYQLEEIAEIIGCETSAVRVNLSRARKKVKEIFFKINNITNL